MIRIWIQANGHCLRAVVLIFALLTLVVVDTPIAGDTDGVTGYSMKLKNKDYDGSDYGPGGEETIVSLDSKTSAVPTITVEQESTFAGSRLALLLRLHWLVYWLVR